MTKPDEKKLASLIRLDEPEELWDIYDAEGRLTGRTHRRGDALGEGEYHLCVHIWTRNARGEYLLTKRASGKCLAGLWETTGGSALAGEDSLSAALREAREETGLRLDPERGELLFRFGGDHYFCDVWLFRQDFAPEDITLQPGETCAWRLADADTVRRLAAEGRFFHFDNYEQVLTQP